MSITYKIESTTSKNSIHAAPAYFLFFTPINFFAGYCGQRIITTRNSKNRITKKALVAISFLKYHITTLNKIVN